MLEPRGQTPRVPRPEQPQAVSFPASRDRVKGRLMVAVPDRNLVDRLGRVPGVGCRVSGVGCQVPGARCQVPGAR